MNFFLQQIENHTDESLLVQGEDLFAQNGILEMEEIEPHLWAFKVTEGGDSKFEVDIQISPSRVKAFSCECEPYQLNRNCAHIVASLLALRRKKNEQKKKKNQIKKVTRSAKKLSTQQILDHLSKEELVGIIKEFTRQNRSLALSLKARFAYKVPLVDSRNAYLQLLESTIQMVRRPDRSINKRGATNIAKILTEMLDQMRLHQLRQLYAEVFALGQSILIKIPPIIGKISTEESILLPQLQANFDILHQLIESPIPAPLKERIWDFLFEEFQKIVYRNHQLDGLFHPLLVSLMEEEEQREQLMELSEKLLSFYRKENKDLSHGLYFHYAIWKNKYGINTIKQFIYHLIEEQEELHHLIQYCIKQKDYVTAEQFALVASALVKSDKEKERLHIYLLKLAELQQQKDKAIQLAEELFFQTKDLVYLRKIKKLSGEAWPGFLQKTLAKINDQQEDNGFDQVLPRIYGEEKLFVQLLDFISQKPSLNLLLNFDHYLLPEYEKKLRPIYLAEVQKYLNMHLGRITSTKIRSIIQHLHSLGAHSIGNELVEVIRKDYAERSSLMEELSLF